jgi:hypothetical protein
LVIDCGTRNRDIRRITNIKSVSVVSKRITSLVVDGDIRDGEAGRTVNGEALDRGVLDVQPSDTRFE